MILVIPIRRLERGVRHDNLVSGSGLAFLIIDAVCSPLAHERSLDSAGVWHNSLVNL